ncbi:MAG TPA: flagellar basal body-associated FliL family protein [Sedimentisphaerales bacterium]|nr:flagellar basal body-associated FliL family protein [Sedimentisphaerales bacterium]
MADGKDIEKQQDTEQEKTDEKTAKKPRIRDFLPWIIMVAVVVSCAGVGFGVGRLLGCLHKTETAGHAREAYPAQEDKLSPETSRKDSDKVWYYNLEPVVANLDEPGVKRYVRATLTLAISSQTDPKKGVAFFDEKKPLLTNGLTIYLASLGLDDIRGDKNLKRVQSQILDTFNEKLFPDIKPQIEGILFREFAVQ